jgi:uncharacterized protein YbjT (DUF2867 family)
VFRREIRNLPVKSASVKILILGATGTLGAPVAEQLNLKGFELRLFSRNIGPGAGPGEAFRGDAGDPVQLRKAMDGCGAVHVSVAGAEEAKVMESVVSAAGESRVELISYVSGCTVSEENRWFPLTDQKFRAEQALIQSGIPYMIFRPTWFFETLSRMVRNGKATVIGKQPHSWSWLAATDFGRMIATAYGLEEARNRIFFAYGPEKLTMNQAMEQYVKARHPEIKKVSNVPVGMMKLVALLSGKRMLKAAISLFAYFEKVTEPGGGEETDLLLGKATTNLMTWLKNV